MSNLRLSQYRSPPQRTNSIRDNCHNLHNSPHSLSRIPQSLLTPSRRATTAQRLVETRQAPAVAMGSAYRRARRARRASCAHAAQQRTGRGEGSTGQVMPVSGRTLAGEYLCIPLLHVCSCFALHRPFVLLVGTAVTLLLLVGGSVALLSAIGDQNLPSTLTGGVAHSSH